MHNEVTPFYRHFEPSETLGTDSHQVRNTITGKVDACADVFPRCYVKLVKVLKIICVKIHYLKFCMSCSAGQAGHLASPLFAALYAE
jgi:hypothetical protein